MKKLIASAIALLWILTVSADDNVIKFSVCPIESDGVPAATVQVLHDRIIRALDRTQALSDNKFNVFDVRPAITVNDAVETEGLVEEVSRVSAELTLVAVNRVDGSVYHTVSIPLKASAVGGKDAALRAMANSLKATDPVFVRFVRTARQRIDDYYMEHCGDIIIQAERLVMLGRADEAAEYLQSVPSGVPCYEQADAILYDIAPQLLQKPDTEMPCDDAPAEASDSTSAPRYDILIDGENLDFEVISCRGDATRGRITVSTRLINRDVRDERPFVDFKNVMTDGRRFERLMIQELNDMRAGSVDMPDSVPVMMNFVIAGVRDIVDVLDYVEIYVRGVKVSIRNLAVLW